MKDEIISKANQSYMSGDYLNAYNLYKQAALRMSTNSFDLNILLCANRLNNISVNKEKLPSENSPYSLTELHKNNPEQVYLNLEKRNNPIWLSLGENCLSDNILQRHGLKSFSSPYAASRSNIDYVIALEKENYASILLKENLVYEDAWGKKVVRSTSIINADDIYEPSCSKGFEFTHHDPISSINDRNSFQRRIQRLNEFRKKKDVVFLYHHRITERSNLIKLREKFSTFISFYLGNQSNCHLIFFYQTLIPKGGDSLNLISFHQI
ncbi:DUF1796 family putative cysteine peptidase [Iodobacter fluviatilis]|uniref:Uncharacterized protein n=1 Tax=Iodobacter fluviatilis TaxID=537 RepID=A0A7G3G955_9NEIS|nr:DUF1796 family putative cysteine peptidase [Iodobacter fluviatilis]QBC43668.1 hypothetical protein C1H71_09000 [Iodobacter fluviatilis]